MNHFFKASMIAITQVICLHAVACGTASPAPTSGPEGGGEPGGGASGKAGSGTATVGGASGETASGGAGGGASGASGAGGAAVGGAPATVRSPLIALDHGTCALDAEGSIQCWGAAPGVWQVPEGAFVDLAGGSSTACAIRQDRTYACFSEPVGMPSPIDYAPSVEATSVAAHRLAICAIDAQGALTCGRAPSVMTDYSPPAGRQFLQVSLGTRFVCALSALDGAASCWGDAGDDPSDCKSLPNAGQLQPPPGEFVAISSGSLSACALDSLGHVSCWGAGEPGDDPSASCGAELYNWGQSAPLDGTFREVSAGLNHTCAVRTDGTIACWGAGTADVCSIDMDAHCRQSRPPSGVFEHVAVGNYHSCAVTAEHKVQCWGYDGGGDGRTTPPMGLQ